ncbi:hypothetical protein BB561_005097 [Smittium simulii]|uniref:Uncharacterized protein n=1 Tax=Smittium simulii TaxID=133385 RepID=A0A2T9YC85_9FUNG|nr:hypothetical protein BB561_005097 [Smittium simulii]
MLEDITAHPSVNAWSLRPFVCRSGNSFISNFPNPTGTTDYKMTDTNLWREFAKLPVIKKFIHEHANKVVSMEFRRASLNNKIAEKKEEYTLGKVSLTVLNFVEKQTRNLPGSEKLAKSIEQQTISIQVMGLKNKVESITAQLKEEDLKFAIKIARIAGATHQFDPEEMTKTEDDLEELITEICDEIRTRKAQQDRRNNHQQPKKLTSPKGNPKGAVNSTKNSKSSGSKNPKPTAKPKKKPQLCKNNKKVYISKSTYFHNFTDSTDLEILNLGHKKKINHKTTEEYVSKINLEFQEILGKQAEETPAKISKSIKKIIDNGKIRIINSDKNLGPVAVYTKYYNEQILKILDNKKNDIPIEKNKKDLIQEVEQATIPLQTYLHQRMKWGFKPNKFLRLGFAHSILKLYILLKLHKTPISFRPITGATDWVTTNLSKALAIKILQYQNEYCIKNSFNLIQKYIRTIISNDYTFGTAYAVSLCPSIDLNTLYKTLYQLTLTSTVVEATKLICENNYFEYNNKLYQQTNGIAMGTNAAPHSAKFMSDTSMAFSS